MRIWKLFILPVVAIFGMVGCDSESSSSPIFKGNVNGIIVIPKLKKDDNNSVSFSCSGLPIPGGYEPLGDANVSFIDNNGTVIADKSVASDSCGRFYVNMDTKDFAMVRVSKAGYHTMLSDINGFESPDKSWGIISTADSNNSFAVRINAEGNSLSYNPQSDLLKYTVVDTRTGRAVLGVPQSQVTLYKDADEVNITKYHFNDLDADLILTLDASGSMESEYIDSNGTSIGTGFDLTYHAAKSFIDELSGNSEVGFTIFDNSVNFLNGSFVSGLGLKDKNGNSVSFPYTADGFERDKKKSKFMVDIYHPHSQVYEANSSLVAEYPYETNGTYAWGGATAYMDAAYTSSKTLGSRNSERKITVLMTDGMDNSSSHTLNEVISNAIKSSVTFYTISMGDYRDDNLFKLAASTGGVYIQANGDNIGEKFRDVLSEIQYFYEIGTNFEENTTAYYRVDVLLDGETVSGLIDLNTTSPAPIPPDEGSEGARLYTKCMPCHGAKAEKSAYGVTEIINTWSSVMIKDALMAYKDGSRDVYGSGNLMSEQIKTYSEGQIDAVSNYISTLDDNSTDQE